MRKDVVERFAEKIIVDNGTGCWNWQASRTPDGYGQFWFEGSRRLAHRVAWILFRGEVPNVIDHFVCDNTSCVNPDHLINTDNRTNILRGINPCATNARKTYCKRGHKLAGSNLILRLNGNRGCKKCRYERSITPIEKVKKKEQNCRYYAKPGIKEKRVEYERKRYLENIEKVKEHNHKYYLQHREKIKAQVHIRYIKLRK